MRPLAWRRRAVPFPCDTLNSVDAYKPFSAGFVALLSGMGAHIGHRAEEATCEPAEAVISCPPLAPLPVDSPDLEPAMGSPVSTPVSGSNDVAINLGGLRIESRLGTLQAVRRHLPR